MRVPGHVLTIVPMVPLHFSLTKPAAVLSRRRLLRVLAKHQTESISCLGSTLLELVQQRLAVSNISLESE
jgi:hypothetical protein